MNPAQLVGQAGVFGEEQLELVGVVEDAEGVVWVGLGDGSRIGGGFRRSGLLIGFGIWGMIVAVLLVADDRAAVMWYEQRL